MQISQQGLRVPKPKLKSKKHHSKKLFSQMAEFILFLQKKRQEPLGILMKKQARAVHQTNTTEVFTSERCSGFGFHQQKLFWPKSSLANIVLA